VILSVCNTGAGEATGAEALSGLARAFFYAEARSPHWEATSDATVKLITKAIAELKANPKIGRAEALRRSMPTMVDSENHYEAHPAFWAPFVLVGERGAARQVITSSKLLPFPIEWVTIASRDTDRANQG
jgi:CHAT domain-containing protein